MTRRVEVGLAASLLLCAALSAKVAGDTAPDFTRPDMRGRPLHLADYRGKWILLNFWASWCGPCLAEMPRFAEWQRSYSSQGLQLIGVAMDDDPAAARRLLDRHPLPYPVVIGDAELGGLFGGVLGLPDTYLIDPAGRIVARFQGGNDLGKMEARIKDSLSSNRH